MTNHVHLVVVPEREESLGQALRDAHTVYAMHFNGRILAHIRRPSQRRRCFTSIAPLVFGCARRHSLTTDGHLTSKKPLNSEMVKC